MSEKPQKPSFSAAFPASSVVIGEFRKVFGADVERKFVSEGGREIGHKLDESRYTVISGKDLIVSAPRKAANGR